MICTFCFRGAYIKASFQKGQRCKVKKYNIIVNSAVTFTHVQKRSPKEPNLFYTDSVPVGVTVAI